MNFKVTKIFDSVSESWSLPICIPSYGDVVRSWTAECSNPESIYYKNPADFCLFIAGEYDRRSGDFILLGTPLKVGLALEFKKSV